MARFIGEKTVKKKRKENDIKEKGFSKADLIVYRIIVGLKLQ